MTGRYVPPALRRQQAGAGTNRAPPAAGDSSNNNPSGPPTRRLANLRRFSRGPQPGDRRAYEIHAHFCGRDYAPLTRSTLNDAAARPRALAYVFLFRYANPRWNPDKIIFAKSNLDHLPGYAEAYADEEGGGDDQGAPVDLIDLHDSGAQAPGDASRDADAAGDGAPAGTASAQAPSTSPKAEQPATTNGVDATESADVETADAPPPAKEQTDTTDSGDSAQPTESKPATTPPAATVSIPADAPPIPVFSQTDGRSDEATATFRFAGWHRLEKVNFLHPQTRELVRMLQQKFMRVARDGRARDMPRDEAAWRRSLAMRWAVVKFARLEAEPAPPAIARFERPPEPALLDLGPEPGPGAERRGSGDPSGETRAEGGLAGEQPMVEGEPQDKPAAVEKVELEEEVSLLD